jgi:hypothetical protein
MSVPPIGLLESPDRRLTLRAGERAALVTEQLDSRAGRWVWLRC